MSNPIDKIRTHFFLGVTDLFRGHMEAERMYREAGRSVADEDDEAVYFTEMAVEMLFEIIRLGLPEAKGEAVLSDLNKAFAGFIEGLPETIADAQDPWDFFNETCAAMSTAHALWVGGEKDASDYMRVLKAGHQTLSILCGAEKTPVALRREARRTMGDVVQTMSLIQDGIERAEREAGWDPTP